MSAQYVQLASDGSGKKVQTYENTISSNVVEAQAAVAIDSTGYSDSFVAITEGSGKKIQAFSNVIGSNTVHAIAIVAVDTSGVSIYG